MKVAVGAGLGVIGALILATSAIVAVWVFLWSARTQPVVVHSLEPRVAVVPEDAVTRTVTADGVAFSVAEANRALRFINDASAEELRRAGIYDKGVTIVLSNRPFASIETFAATYGIGPGTVRRVAAAAR